MRKKKSAKTPSLNERYETQIDSKFLCVLLLLLLDTAALPVSHPVLFSVLIIELFNWKGLLKVV